MGKHLKYKDRQFIERELKNNMSIEEIAAYIGATPATIYNEIRRSGETKENYTALKGQMAILT